VRLPAISLALALLAALAPQAAWALVGEITHLSGAVVARRADGSRLLSVKSEVREGDLLVTADNTYARVKFSDGAEVVLRPNSQLKIDAYAYDEKQPGRDNVAISLIKGGLRSITGLLARRNPANFRVATPTATVGIRGTNFGALFCNNDCGGVETVGGGTPTNGLHVDVSDGVIIVSTPAGSREFRIGEFGFVAGLDALPVLVPPNQGTRVNLPPQTLNTQIQGGTVGKGGALECSIGQ